MRQRQNGITFIGWLFLLVPVAIVVYAGIRVTPIYLNYFKVVKALQQVAADNSEEQQVNMLAVQKDLEHRFDIDTINNPTLDQVKLQRNGRERMLRAEYEEYVPLFANISLRLSFDVQAKMN
jgi:hypothetical protein